MRKMRVGILVNEFNPEVGGAHNFVSAVIDALLLLDNSDSQIELIYILEGKAEPGKFKSFHSVRRSARIERIALTFFNSKFNKILVKPLLKFSPLHASIKNLKLDFLFFLGSSPMPLEIPYGVIVWDLQHRTHPWFPELIPGWKNRDHLASLVLPRASIVITGTAEGRNQIVNFYGVQLDNIHVIPHPVPPDIFAAARCSEPESPFTLLYPAQFWPHKNHVVIVKAIKLFLDSNTQPIRVVFVGSDKGNLKHIQNEINNHGVADFFVIKGFVSRGELLDLYRNSDALVYASFSGPENLPPLEAFACHLPVIYAEFPGAREQLGSAALYFDPTSAVKLKDCISELVTTPSMRTSLVAQGVKQLEGRSNKDFVRALLIILTKFASVRGSWE